MQLLSNSKFGIKSSNRCLMWLSYIGLRTIILFNCSRRLFLLFRDVLIVIGLIRHSSIVVLIPFLILVPIVICLIRYISASVDLIPFLILVPIVIHLIRYSCASVVLIPFLILV